MTFRLPEGHWITVKTVLRIGRSSSVVDNIGFGGLYVPVDAYGRTGSAIDFSDNREYSHHPDTGEQIEGVELDGFSSVTELAVRASRALGVMGTLGWDISLTKAGPMLIEGNAYYGIVQVQQAEGGLVTDDMLRGLNEHGPFSAWDKSRMYPAFHRR